MNEWSKRNPFRMSSSLYYLVFFTYLFDEQDSYLYPVSSILLLLLPFTSTFPSYFLLRSSLHPTLHFFLPMSSITPFIASSCLHLPIDNLPVLCLLQPSQSDPVRGLMLWKMTVNRHFYCHHHRFGATCHRQPLLPGNSPDSFPTKGGSSCVLRCDRDPSLISIISQFVLSFCC